MSVNPQLLEYNLPQIDYSFSILCKQNRESVVAISMKYPIGADKAVQISRAVQPEYSTRKAAWPFYSGYQIFFMSGSFGFVTF